MKSFLALVCVFALVAAETPLEKPNGIFFIAPRSFKPKDLVEVTEEVMAQLKSQDGSDSGKYHVYRPDGRLQKVQYTTAPIQQAKVLESPKPFILVPQKQNLAFKVQPIYAEEKSAKILEEKPSGYVASIRYTDVEPITGPVYSYKPEPLQRIVRYAPMYL